MSDSIATRSNTTPQSKLIGYVDHIDAEIVSGWIIDFDNVHDYHTISVLIDGVEVCTGLANEHRDDLASNAGFAGTAHAFNIKLAGVVTDGREHECTIIDSKSKYVLNDGIKSVFFPKSAALPKHLDVALVGQEGWLFLCHDSNGCIEQYVGQLRLNQKILDSYVNIYQKRQSYLRSQKIHYILAIVSGKESIYSEYLPKGVKATQLSSVREQFTASVGPVVDAPIVDLHSVLLANKNRGHLYYMNDSHWSYLGAMVAAAEIIQNVKTQFPQVPSFDESKFTLVWAAEGAGDLSLKERLDYVNGDYIAASEHPWTGTPIAAIGIEYQITAHEVAEHAFTHLSATRPTRLYKKVESNDLPRAIILRDSYADWQIPFLAESFSESLFIWTRNLDEKVVESFKPDLVIEQVVDRFLVQNRTVAPSTSAAPRAAVSGSGAAVAFEAKNPHLYGISSYVPDAPFLDTDELSLQSGENTGNFVFCHAISRILEAGPQSYPWGVSLSHLTPQSDRLVVPLANWLGPHIDLGDLAEIFKTIPVPIVGVGLGAQAPISGIDIDAIPEGSWEWLRVVSAKSASDRPNISLRGQATYDAIAKKGLAEKCVVTGCPSNFINPSLQLGKDIQKKWKERGLHRVAVTAGTPENNIPILEQSLVTLVEQTQGIYVCQAPLDMLRLFKGEFDKISKEKLASHMNYLLPHLNEDQFKRWMRRWSYVYTSVPEWLTQMNQYDVVVGARIHGVMAGIQGGVPGICICTDSRTFELSQTMKIPYIDARDYQEGISLEQMATVLENWDADAYDENRRMLAKRFHDFFLDNDLQVRGAPEKILKAAAMLA